MKSEKKSEDQTLWEIKVLLDGVLTYEVIMVRLLETKWQCSCEQGHDHKEYSTSWNGFDENPGFLGNGVWF